MRMFFFPLLQCTWGSIQTFLGLILFLLHREDPRERYRGAVVVCWKRRSSVSLGMFLFLAPTCRPFQTPEELLRHEYGHSVQSLLLGPLYLILIGIPSVLWASLPYCRRRREKGLPYSAFYTERWADALGKK